MMAAAEQQNALYRDYAAFQQVFPEVQQVLKNAMARLIKDRPADPIAFLAMELREANAEIKLEKLRQEEEDRKEKEVAALRIQSMGRAKKDKARVEQIKVNNGIFIRELYVFCRFHTKMRVPHVCTCVLLAWFCRHVRGSSHCLVCFGSFKKLAKDNIATGTRLLLFAKGGDDRKSLGLPARLGQHIPPKVNAACKKVVLAIATWPAADKAIEYVEFASMFGMSEKEAVEAEQAAAAVRIQAMSRKRKGAVVALDRRRNSMEKSAAAGAYTRVL